METTWIRVGGLSVRAPVTAGTNLLLSGQCLVYFLGLRHGPTRRARAWAGFFLMMSLATLGGVFKHGAAHVLDAPLVTALLGASNLASGLSTVCAQEAAVASWARRRPGALRLLIDAQLAVFVGANIVLGPHIELLVANTAIGLLPVIVAEVVGRKRREGAAFVAAGLATSLLTGLVYLSGFSFGRWLNHIDLAHVLMGVSFFVIHRGVIADGRWPWS